MRLVIVSGLSGSGKSVALHELEDIDFYCVDNIPAALLKPFIAHTIRGTDEVYRRTAVGLDARNRPNEINTIPALVGELKRSGIACEVLFLHASDEVLLKRYAETRRKHPLVSAEVSLREAIDSERKLLAGHGAGNCLERADFRRRKPEPLQPFRAGAQDGCGVERIEGGSKPLPDCVGARRRKLLCHNDGGKSGETVRPPPQRRPPGFGDERGETRLGFAEGGQRRVKIGFGVDVGRHGRVRLGGRYANDAPRAYLID